MEDEEFVGVDATVEAGKIYMYDYALNSDQKASTVASAVLNFMDAYEVLLAEYKEAADSGDSDWADSAVDSTKLDAVETAEEALLKAFADVYGSNDMPPLKKAPAAAGTTFVVL